MERSITVVNPFIEGTRAESVKTITLSDGSQRYAPTSIPNENGLINPFAETFESVSEAEKAYEYNAMAVQAEIVSAASVDYPMDEDGTGWIEAVERKTAAVQNNTTALSSAVIVESHALAVSNASTANSVKNSPVSVSDTNNTVKLEIAVETTERGTNDVAVAQNKGKSIVVNPGSEPHGSSKKLPSSYDIMRHVLMINNVRSVGEMLYRYNGTYFVPISENDAKRMVIACCRSIVKEYGHPSYVKEIYDFLTMDPEAALEFKDTIHPDSLGFRDGILNLCTREFVPPTPEIFITNIVDDYYCANTPLETPVFDRFIYTAMLGRPALIAGIWEAIGYIITDDNRGKAFLVFQGVPDSGKSLLIQLLSSLFSEDATCSLQINALGSRFGLASALGKKLITFADLPRNPVSDEAVGIIKALTGGDALSCEQKYMPIQKFWSTAKLVFATNHPIRLQSEDEAFMNRVVIIPFMNQIPKEQQDNDLLEDLKKEKHGIIVKAIEAYTNLRKRKYIFSGNNEAMQASMQYSAPTISLVQMIAAFAENCCELAEGVFTPTEELYNSFVRLCCENSFTPPAKEMFSRLFASRFGDKVKDHRSTIDGKKLRGYIGIRLRR